MKDYKIGYCKPPNRFSSTNQPKHKTPRGPSILTPLKRFLEKNIKYEDPDTRQMTQGKIQDVIALRHILNATTGDHNAITDIMDRVDGKTVQKVSGESGGRVVVVIHNNRDGRKESRTSILPAQAPASHKR